MISKLNIDSTAVLISKSLSDFEQEINSTFNSFSHVFLLMDANTHLHCFHEFKKVFPESIISIIPDDISGPGKFI
jgi:hypothetical protein